MNCLQCLVSSLPVLLLLLATRATHADDSAELRERFLKEAPTAWAEAETMSQNVRIETTWRYVSRPATDREYTSEVRAIYKVRGKLALKEEVHLPVRGKGLSDVRDDARELTGMVDGVNDRFVFMLRRRGENPWKLLLVPPADHPDYQADDYGRLIALAPWSFQGRPLAQWLRNEQFQLTGVESLPDDHRTLVKVSFIYTRKPDEFSLLEGGWFTLDPQQRWSLQGWHITMKESSGTIVTSDGSMEYCPGADVIPWRFRFTNRSEKAGILTEGSGEYRKFERSEVPLEDFRPEAYGVQTPPASQIDRDGHVHEYFGRQAPPISIIDARGVSKDFKLADLRGKWVLLEFWGPICPPCLKESLPGLIKFYDDHAKDRDRFEILAVCVVHYEDGPKTIEQLDRVMAPTVKSLWGGRSLPFPIVMDDDQKTFKGYRILAAPAKILIDPDGNVVKDGDEKLLAEKLAKPRS